VKPEDGYEIISHENEYIGFIEHYNVDGIEYYNIFYDDVIEKWNNVGGSLRLIERNHNLAGLPIRYKNDQNEEDENAGRSSLEDIIPLIDQLEDVLSKFSDSFYKHHNPLLVISGQVLKGEGLNQNIVGGGLQLDDGNTANMITNKLDHLSFKEIYGTIYQALLTISNTPGIAMSSVEISNVSESSLLLLYSVADVRGALNESWLKEGLMKRLEVWRKLMKLKGIQINDDDFEEIDLIFTYARPKNKTEIVETMAKLREIGAMSLETIVENNPYTSNKTQEMDRLKNETLGNNFGK
jgi:SPP1 family phage portal protein